MTDMMRCTAERCNAQHPFGSLAISWGWQWGITEMPRGSRLIEVCPRHAASINTIARLEAVGTDRVQVKHITDSLIIRAIYIVATDDERLKAFWSDMCTLLWWVPWRVLERKLEQLERRGVIDRHGSVTVISNMEAVR